MQAVELELLKASDEIGQLCRPQGWKSCKKRWEGVPTWPGLNGLSRAPGAAGPACALSLKDRRPCSAWGGGQDGPSMDTQRGAVVRASERR